MSKELSGQVLSKLMDLTAHRHRILAHNLANVSTPGFERQDLEFAAQFREAVKQDAERLGALQVAVTTDESAAVRPDGNSVQLEQELSELSKNAMLHQTALQLMAAHMAIQRIAVTGRSA